MLLDVGPLRDGRDAVGEDRVPHALGGRRFRPAEEIDEALQRLVQEGEQLVELRIEGLRSLLVHGLAVARPARPLPDQRLALKPQRLVDALAHGLGAGGVEVAGAATHALERGGTASGGELVNRDPAKRGGTASRLRPPRACPFDETGKRLLRLDVSPNVPPHGHIEAHQPQRSPPGRCDQESGSYPLPPGSPFRLPGSTPYLPRPRSGSRQLPGRSEGRVSGLQGAGGGSGDRDRGCLEEQAGSSGRDRKLPDEGTGSVRTRSGRTGRGGRVRRFRSRLPGRGGSTPATLDPDLERLQEALDRSADRSPETGSLQSLPFRPIGSRRPDRALDGRVSCGVGFRAGSLRWGRLALIGPPGRRTKTMREGPGAHWAWWRGLWEWRVGLGRGGVPKSGVCSRSAPLGGLLGRVWVGRGGGASEQSLVREPHHPRLPNAPSTSGSVGALREQTLDLETPDRSVNPPIPLRDESSGSTPSVRSSAAQMVNTRPRSGPKRVTPSSGAGHGLFSRAGPPRPQQTPTKRRAHLPPKW